MGAFSLSLSMKIHPPKKTQKQNKTNIYLYIYIEGSRNTSRIASRPRTKTVRGFSPPWHRRLRHSRAAARDLVRKFARSDQLWPNQLTKCCAALRLLCGHHTRPKYRVSRLVFQHLVDSGFPYSSQLMSSWSHWRGADKQRKGRGHGQQKGSGKGPKDKSQENKGKAAFPSYDGPMLSSGSSSTPAASTALPTEVIGLLQKIADKDADVAAAMSNIIPEDHNEQAELKEQQRRLNAIRKVQTRIHKKERQIKDKETQMQVFLQDIKRHVDSEKTRHRTETEALQKEIEELKETLVNLKAGKTLQDNKVETMEDLEELLDPYDGEKGELKAQLDKATKEKELMQKQLLQMQTQMAEFMMTYGQQRGNSPTIGPPNVLKTPVTPLQDGAPAASAPTKKRDAMQPFGVARTEGLNHKTGPYDKSAEKATPVNLESPDR